MNNIIGLSVNHFEYQFNDDKVEVRHEGELLGVITPVAQQQFSFLKGLVSDKVSLTIGNRKVEVFRSDWEEAVAPRVRLLDEMQSFNPQTREEAKKCMRVFLESHQTGESSSAMEAFKLLSVARKVSLQSGRFNPLWLSALECRMAILAPAAGAVALQAINNLSRQARENAVQQFVQQTTEETDVEQSLSAYLQSRGINAQLLLSTDLENDVVLENASRAYEELEMIFSELKANQGILSLLFVQTERLLLNSLRILDPKKLHERKEAETRRLRDIILELMNDNSIPEEEKVKRLLESEGINPDFIMQTAASSTSSSQTSMVDREKQPYMERAKGVIFEALRLWGHGEISGQPVLDALVEYGKAVCRELGDEEALEMTQWIRQVMVDFWWNGGKEDHQNTTLLLSNIERRLLDAETYIDWDELSDDVIYLKDYLENALPMIGDMVEQAKREGFSFHEIAQHPYLEYFDTPSQFFETLRDHHQQIIDRMMSIIRSNIWKFKGISMDEKMSVGFPQGFGTDTSDIELLELPESREYGWLFKVNMAGNYDGGLNYLLYRYRNGEYPSKSPYTEWDFDISMASYKNLKTSSDAITVKMHIWSQMTEKVKRSSRIWGRSPWCETRLAILSFDLSRPTEDVLSRFEDHMKDMVCEAPSNIQMILVGTKLDTLQGDSMAKQKLLELKRFAEERNLPYCVTSALEGYGIEEFEKLMIYGLQKFIDPASQAASSS